MSLDPIGKSNPALRRLTPSFLSLSRAPLRKSMATSSFSSSHWITKGSNHLPRDRFTPFGGEYSCRIYSFHTDLHWHWGKSWEQKCTRFVCLLKRHSCKHLSQLRLRPSHHTPHCCGNSFEFDATRALKFIVLASWMSGHSSCSQVRRPRPPSWMFKKTSIWNLWRFRYFLHVLRLHFQAPNLFQLLTAAHLLLCTVYWPPLAPSITENWPLEDCCWADIICTVDHFQHSTDPGMVFVCCLTYSISLLETKVIQKYPARLKNKQTLNQFWVHVFLFSLIRNLCFIAPYKLTIKLSTVGLADQCFCSSLWVERNWALILLHVVWFTVTGQPSSLYPRNVGDFHAAPLYLFSDAGNRW